MIRPKVRCCLPPSPPPPGSQFPRRTRRRSMQLAALCAVVATLRVLSNRCQFFLYESVTLSCGRQGNSSEWRVKRNTSTNKNEDGSIFCESSNESHCVIQSLYPLDSGVYWCESGAGECSNAVSIDVTNGSVVLESPAQPVMEGDAVTLRCRRRATLSSNLTADFYRDELLIWSSSTGDMTIRGVSKADEGLYRCSISGAADSALSRLTVTAGRREPPYPPLACILLPVAAVCLLLVSVMLFCLWRRHKGSDVSYADVTITQEVQPQRIRDVASTETFYSNVKVGTT